MLDSPASVYTSFGSEPFTPNNELRYKTFQMQDNFTRFGSEAHLNFGWTAERYESENIFFPGDQSVYVYNSLDGFLRGRERIPRESESDDFSGEAAPFPGADATTFPGRRNRFSRWKFRTRAPMRRTTSAPRPT